MPQRAPRTTAPATPAPRPAIPRTTRRTRITPSPRTPRPPPGRASLRASRLTSPTIPCRPHPRTASPQTPTHTLPTGRKSCSPLPWIALDSRSGQGPRHPRITTSTGARPHPRAPLQGGQWIMRSTTDRSAAEAGPDGWAPTARLGHARMRRPPGPIPPRRPLHH